jgi:hypothetical protein
MGEDHAGPRAHLGKFLRGGIDWSSRKAFFPGKAGRMSIKAAFLYMKELA